MAIQTKQYFFQEVTQLHQRLSQALNTFQGSGPAEQLEQAATLTNDVTTLTNLQKKVQSTYKGAQDAIPGVTQEEVDAISGKLSASSDILDAIEKNQDIALDFLELANETEAVFKKMQEGNVSEQIVKSLKGRISDLISTAGINEGNLNALLALGDMLVTPQNPLQQPHPAQQSHGAIIAEQDESFQIEKFKTKFNELNRSWKNVPDEDFELAFIFYFNLKQAYQLIKGFHLPKNQTAFEELIASSEKLLLVMIDKRKEIENPAASGLRVGTAPTENCNAFLLEFNHCLQLQNDPQIIQDALSKLPPNDKEKLFGAVSDILLSESKIRRALPLTLMGQSYAMWGADIVVLRTAVQKLLSQPAQVQPPVVHAPVSPAFLELKKALEPAKENGYDVLKLQKSVQAAFEKLSAGEKTQLLEALSKILIEKNERKAQLPRSLEKVAISAWPGSYALKLEAVEKVISAAATTPTAPAAKKLSDTMQERFNAVRIEFKRQQASHSAPVAPIQEDLTSLHPDRKILESIRMLQKTLPLLTPEGSDLELQAALEIIATLDSIGTKTPFKISGPNSLFIADRPCFHLYLIHKSESPKKVVPDLLYGTRAFAGVYETSNSERSRAILRTIFELVLEGMEDAINFNAVEDFQELREILKGLTGFSNADLPPNSLSAFLDGIDYTPPMDAIIDMRGTLKHTWQI